MVPPLSVADLKALARSYLAPTLTVDDAQLLEALNYGYGKLIRGIVSVRPQFYLSRTPFAVQGNVQDYDIGGMTPAVWRPLRLLVSGPGTRAVRFKYRSLVDRESEDAETSVAGTWTTLFYDILDGRLPRPAVDVTGQSLTQVLVSDVSDIRIGSIVQVPGFGVAAPLPGSATATAGAYEGYVQAIAGNVLTLTPPLASVPPFTPGGLLPIWQRVLHLMPPPATGMDGTLYYNFRPARLRQDTDALDAVASDHADLIIQYAVAQAKRAVGDSDSRDYFEDAQALRSELLQDMEPLSSQNSEALGTELGDW